MNHRIRIAAGVLLLSVASAFADEPKKLTPAERKEMTTKMLGLNSAGIKAYQSGKYSEAHKSYDEALATARNLYPKDEYPSGHPNIASILSNLAFVHESEKKPAEAMALCREALEMRQRYYRRDHVEVAHSLSSLGSLLLERRKYAEAEAMFRDALHMRQRLYKGDHPAIARTQLDLARAMQMSGRIVDAEDLMRQTLDMQRRLFKGDHPDLATTLNWLEGVLNGQQRYAEAEPIAREALAMNRRMFGKNNPNIVNGLNSVAIVLQLQGKYAEAEPLFREALAIAKNQIRGDHPIVLFALNQLAFVLWEQAKYDESERLLVDALKMARNLYKNDHRDTAYTLMNLAGVRWLQGKYAQAEPLNREALDMYRRLFPGDTNEATRGLTDLARVLHHQGKYAEAEPLYRESLAMHKRMSSNDSSEVGRTCDCLADLLFACGRHADAVENFREAMRIYRSLVLTNAATTSEGEALTLLATTPPTRDRYLSNAQILKTEPATVYAEVWAAKAFVARVYEKRLQSARAAASDPKAAAMLAQLADARRRRAELIYAPQVTDLATLKKRDEDTKALNAKIAELDRDLRPMLPIIDQTEKLNRATPADLQKVLPTDAAVVDFLRYVHVVCDKDKPGKPNEKRTERYVAFVATRNRIAWIDLGAAAPIEAAIQSWREAITGGRANPATAQTVGELVWTKVRKELPAEIKTLYIAPDVALSRVPWPALPGDKPGSILLEQYTIASIPHGVFLLGQLWSRESKTRSQTTALVVGGVKYDAEVPAAPVASTSRGDPAVKPDTRLEWPFLPASAVESDKIAALAAEQRFPVVQLIGEKATRSDLLAALPKARYAHLATHGFFADPSFRSALQLDAKDFEQTKSGERIGRAALSPLVMTGLILAGANRPQAPGRGIVTGEALIDLDLTGLDLAVLSACETGLGDVAGGEGAFGLQRAFHLAGARAVVASLWRVNDAATAALMTKFYHEMWVNKRTPIEALREAQLFIYYHPELIPDVLGERGAPKRTEALAIKGANAQAGAASAKRADTKLWAAFVLSGLGK